MGFTAYTFDDHDHEDLPQAPGDWDEWVSAGRTRNWCLQDPLLDWLEVHGDAKGFGRDPKPDPRTDFQDFIFRQGHACEAAVIDKLATTEHVFRINGGTRSIEACAETFAAMLRGEHLIHQAVLRNPQQRTYGAADLLIRSDVLRRLFPDAIPEHEAHAGAPGIEAADWHYRVVDVKFTELKLDKSGNAANEHLPYMAQVFVYNEALGRIQGFLPSTSYLLGRGWAKGDNDPGSTNCLDRLAPVPNNCEIRGTALPVIVDKAVRWLRSVRSEGSAWDPRTEPRMLELRPNPGNQQNYPWHNAVAKLASDFDDVILAWQVGTRGRDLAHQVAVERLCDPLFSAALAGVKGENQRVLDRILAVNRDPDAPPLSPDHIEAAWDQWGEPAALEFYVDFETVNNLNDDFAQIPEQNGQPLIFMIGCGHMEDADWQFACFVADGLTLASEARVIEDWLAHMELVRARLAPEVQRPLVFHWSPAETSGGLKAARTRHPAHQAEWVEPNWFDFLNKVMNKEPVVVRGPMGFGLKTVARSMKEHGLIQTEWGDGVADGLGAMVAAWWCDRESRTLGCSLVELDLMKDVMAYNEVDCRVMMEIIMCLRGHSGSP